MKRIKSFLCVVALAATLSVPIRAGHIESGIVPPPPPDTAVVETVPLDFFAQLLLDGLDFILPLLH